MKVKIRKCARCGEDHEQLEMDAFVRPPRVLSNDEVVVATHWALCPKTAQPVMIHAPGGP